MVTFVKTERWFKYLFTFKKNHNIELPSKIQESGKKWFYENIIACQNSIRNLNPKKSFKKDKIINFLKTNFFYTTDAKFQPTASSNNPFQKIYRFSRHLDQSINLDFLDFSQVTPFKNFKSPSIRGNIPNESLQDLESPRDPLNHNLSASFIFEICVYVFNWENIFKEGVIQRVIHVLDTKNTNWDFQK